MILNRENMRNKKVILILCLLVLVSGSVQAQRLKAVQNEKGRYGFMTEDGTVVIKYKYDEATPFKDGIAKIGKDGKYSLILMKMVKSLQNGNIHISVNFITGFAPSLKVEILKKE